MDDKPRAYTAEEVRDQLLDTIRDSSKYWANLNDKTPQERCDGLAHSILALLDGCNMAMPGFMLTTDPHPDDKEFLRHHGENWYDKTPMDFMLHEYFYKINGEWIDR